MGGWDEGEKEDASEESEEEEKDEAAGLAEGEDHVEGLEVACRIETVLLSLAEGAIALTFV